MNEAWNKCAARVEAQIKWMKMGILYLQNSNSINNYYTKLSLREMSKYEINPFGN